MLADKNLNGTEADETHDSIPEHTEINNIGRNENVLEAGDAEHGTNESPESVIIYEVSRNRKKEVAAKNLKYNNGRHISPFMKQMIGGYPPMLMIDDYVNRLMAKASNDVISQMMTSFIGENSNKAKRRGYLSANRRRATNLDIYSLTVSL